MTLEHAIAQNKKRQTARKQAIEQSRINIITKAEQEWKDQDEREAYLVDAEVSYRILTNQ